MTDDPDHPAPGGPPDEPCGTLTIELRGARHVVPAGVGETIVQAAFRAGLAPPVSCLSGLCATCVAQVTEGRAVMTAGDALTPAEIAEGYVLTCQAVPVSRVVTVIYDD